MFKQKINLNELISTGTTFEVDLTDTNLDDNIDEVTKDEYQEEVIKHANFNCIGDFEDEPDYDKSEPFEVLASRMENILPDGTVKKKIIREGYGNVPDEKSRVKIHYNAYTEFNEEPFDCTYARKQPHTFVLNNGDVIPGLDLAVQTMRLNEKAQFLIKPELAYGSFGCLDRIAPNATVLFQIELLEFANILPTQDFDNVPEENQNEFSKLYNHCLALCANAKALFNRNISAAIKEYNTAVSMLDKAQLSDYDDQVKEQELRFKLYSNLLVSYTKIENPKKACTNFNRLRELTEGTDLEITAKAYFNNAKCLRMLGEYNLAKKRLRLAHQLEPRNQEILNEFKEIDDAERQFKEQERKIAQGLIAKGN